jgi:hypothetical protein
MLNKHNDDFFNNYFEPACRANLWTRFFCKSGFDIPKFCLPMNEIIVRKHSPVKNPHIRNIKYSLQISTLLKGIDFAFTFSQQFKSYAEQSF